MGLKSNILEGSVYVGYWALAYFILLPIIFSINGDQWIKDNQFAFGLFAMLFSVIMVRLFKGHNRKMGRMMAQ